MRLAANVRTHPITPEWAGTGLLSPAWGEEVDRLVTLTAAAYAAIAEGRADNFGLWTGTRTQLVEAWNAQLEAHGLTAAPFYLRALRRRLAPAALRADKGEHVALVEALFTDIGQEVAAHCHYRLATDGNLHFAFTGPTGSAKSSCAITIADWLSPIEPGRLIEHVNFDLGELPQRLRTKTARQTVIQDEFVSGAGEGSRTHAALFENLEDTMRASQVNLFVCSPRRQEHATMQACFEAIAWNRDAGYTLFLVWVDNMPEGVVAVPWCRRELWGAYKPWKAANVERSVSGAFRDSEFTARTAMRVVDDPRVVKWLASVKKRPRKTDVEEAIDLFRGDTLSVMQKANVSRWLAATINGYGRVRDQWDSLFPGVRPSKGFLQLAEASARGSRSSKADEDEEEGHA